MSTPSPSIAVGRFYEDFEQTTTDEDVHALLERPIPVRRMETAR
jgi:predicted phosphoribosyltransferase